MAYLFGMSKEIRISIVGLDTSHSIEFPKRMQAPDCPKEQRVEGMRAVSCLRFTTRFQSEEGMDNYQQQLEKWGVKVTTDFDEATANCDAIMIHINDPAYHLEYFSKCAGLGKPIFLDKPMADTVENGKAISDLATSGKVRLMSASSLRFVAELNQAAEEMSQPLFVSTYGALGKAPAGSSVVWYGVHSFEMLQRATGRGAESVHSLADRAGVVAIIGYSDERRGLVELTEGGSSYSGCLRDHNKAISYVVDMKMAYTCQLREIRRFFCGEDLSLQIEDTLEVMAMLDAAEASLQSGKPEPIRVRFV